MPSVTCVALPVAERIVERHGVLLTSSSDLRRFWGRSVNSVRAKEDRNPGELVNDAMREFLEQHD